VPFGQPIWNGLDKAFRNVVHYRYLLIKGATMSETMTMTASTTRELGDLLERLGEEHPQYPIGTVLEAHLDVLYGLTYDLHRRLEQIRQECRMMGEALTSHRSLAEWAGVAPGWADVDFLRARLYDTETVVKQMAWVVNATPGALRVDIDEVLWDLTGNAARWATR